MIASRVASQAATRHSILCLAVAKNSGIWHQVHFAAAIHVDITPPEQFVPCERQVDLAGLCGNKLVEKLVACSRQHNGAIRFDALTQVSRPNHTAVVEMWNTAAPQEAH